VQSRSFSLALKSEFHAEDRLLLDRFGEAFEGYRGTVAAYIPFLR
jgi:hypothetical protein